MKPLIVSASRFLPEMYITITVILLLLHTISRASVPYTVTQITETKSVITLEFQLLPNDFLYADYFTITTDSPHVMVSSWKSSHAPTSLFCTEFKETKNVFTSNVTITVEAEKKQDYATNAHVNVLYYQHSHKKFNALTIPVFTPSSLQQPLSETVPVKQEIAQQCQRISSPELLITKRYCTYYQKARQSMQYPWFKSAVLLVLFFLLVVIAHIPVVITGILLGLYSGIYYYAPLHCVLWISSVGILVLGIALIKQSTRYSNRIALHSIALLGMLCTASSLYIGAKAYNCRHITIVSTKKTSH